MCSFFFFIDVKYISIIENQGNRDKSCSRKGGKRKTKTENDEYVPRSKKGHLFLNIVNHFYFAI